MLGSLIVATAVYQTGRRIERRIDNAYYPTQSFVAEFAQRYVPDGFVVSEVVILVYLAAAIPTFLFVAFVAGLFGVMTMGLAGVAISWLVAIVVSQLVGLGVVRWAVCRAVDEVAE